MDKVYICTILSERATYVQLYPCTYIYYCTCCMCLICALSIGFPYGQDRLCCHNLYIQSQQCARRYADKVTHIESDLNANSCPLYLLLLLMVHIIIVVHVISEDSEQPFTAVFSYNTVYLVLLCSTCTMYIPASKFLMH